MLGLHQVTWLLPSKCMVSRVKCACEGALKGKKSVDLTDIIESVLAKSYVREKLGKQRRIKLA